MTDTSTAAVTRLLEELDVANAAIDAVKPGGILSSNDKLSAALFALYRIAPAARDLVPALLAERDAALAEVARLKADRDNGAKDYCALMERHDAMQAEVARLSTPPDDAEVAELGERLMNHGGMSWETSACYNGTREEAADALTRLSHAHAALIEKVIAAGNLRDEYHKLPNEKLRPGQGEGKKSRAKKLWLRAFGRAVIAARRKE